jgi:hypothetical protein
MKLQNISKIISTYLDFKFAFIWDIEISSNLIQVAFIWIYFHLNTFRFHLISIQDALQFQLWITLQICQWTSWIWKTKIVNFQKSNCLWFVGLWLPRYCSIAMHWLILDICPLCNVGSKSGLFTWSFPRLLICLPSLVAIGAFSASSYCISSLILKSFPFKIILCSMQQQTTTSGGNAHSSLTCWAILKMFSLKS